MMRRIAICLSLFLLSACGGGKTIIRSEPPAAFVTVNGTPQGVTPLEIKLDCGESKEFKIRVSSPGYVPETKTVQCRRLRGAKSNIFFELKPGKAPSDKETKPLPVKQENFGAIEIKSTPPESEVFLNDTLIGTTPISEQKIKTGTYILEVRKSGFKPWKETIRISPGSTARYFPILEEE